MIRTQVYLTDEEKEGLENISRMTGRKQSELIREALDMYLDLTDADTRDMVLKEAQGSWTDGDRPDPESLRRSWDRQEK